MPLTEREQGSDESDGLLDRVDSGGAQSLAAVCQADRIWHVAGLGKKQISRDHVEQIVDLLVDLLIFHRQVGGSPLSGKR